MSSQVALPVASNEEIAAEVVIGVQKPSESLSSVFDTQDAQILQSVRDSPVAQQPVTTFAPPQLMLI